MEESEENEIKRKRQKFEASKDEQEEENSELPSLSLSLSSSSSPNLPQPNIASPLKSSLTVTGSSPPLSSSSSDPDYHLAPSLQALLSQAFSQTPLQLSPTHPLFNPSPPFSAPPSIPNTTTHPSPSPSPLTSGPVFILSPLPSESPLTPNNTTHPSPSLNSSLSLFASRPSSPPLSELPLFPNHPSPTLSPNPSPSHSLNPSPLPTQPLYIPSPLLSKSPLILNTTTPTHSSPIPCLNPLTSRVLYIPSPALSKPLLISNIDTTASPSPSPSTSRATRNRRNQSGPNGAPTGEKSVTVPVSFPWATNRRATIHSLAYLRENQILTITGGVLCRTCENSYEMGFDLEEKFAEISSYIARNKSTMHDRAQEEWLNPILPTCRKCGNSVRPVVSEKKKSINWLFLLLGQMLGCLTLGQLKYFLKHTNRFRTGAKDRIVYLTYLGLCKQLDPSGPFDGLS